MSWLLSLLLTSPVLAIANYQVRRKEGRKEARKEGGERRAPNKAGLMRPPLLIGIKWEWIWTIETKYGLDQGSMRGSCVEEEEEEEEEEEGGRRKTGP